MVWWDEFRGPLRGPPRGPRAWRAPAKTVQRLPKELTREGGRRQQGSKNQKPGPDRLALRSFARCHVNPISPMAPAASRARVEGSGASVTSPAV